MKSSIWRSFLVFALLIGVGAGCGDFGGGFAPRDRGGERNGAPADADGYDSGSGFSSGRERSESRDWMPSRSESWGADRSMPSDSMPSTSESWGADRSMPSDSMPSTSDSWGSDRSMPSDSMPSRSESWGSDRSMPSDSMPSRSFPSRDDSDPY